MSLLLTPEKQALLMQKYHKGTIKTLTELANALCQSQLSNVIKALTEEKDKPDSEGWWIFKDLDDEIYFYKLFIYTQDERGNNFCYRQNKITYSTRGLDGKWTKALVPEGG